MKIPKIIKKTAVKSVPYLTLIKSQYQREDNEPRDWYYCTRRELNGNKLSPRTDAVMIAGKTPEGKWLVIREYRVPAEECEIGFPAGLIDKGESPEQTAKRELMEETGYEITKIHKVSPAGLNSAGITDECIYVVLCDVKKNGEQKLEPSEEIEVLLVDGVYDPQITENDFWGIKCWIILDAYETNKKLGLKMKCKKTIKDK